MKKTRGQKVPAVRRGRALPDDACPACGTKMVEKRGTLRLPVNGEGIAVPSAAHLNCPKCGEVLLRFQDAKRLGEDAIAIYRRKHGLPGAAQGAAAPCGCRTICLGPSFPRLPWFLDNSKKAETLAHFNFLASCQLFARR